jgi:hypothetical protein
MGKIKTKMSQTIAITSLYSGAVIANLSPYVSIHLPEKTSASHSPP